MNPIFLARVKPDGKLQFTAPMRALLDRHLSALSGKPVEITIKQKRNQRSSQANRYYFGVVVPLIAEHCGYEREEMHEALAMKFLRIEDDPITGSPRRKRTPETDTKEFAEYVDACIRFAAELGVYVPAPGEVAA